MALVGGRTGARGEVKSQNEEHLLSAGFCLLPTLCLQHWEFESAGILPRSTVYDMMVPPDGKRREAVTLKIDGATRAYL